jgi:hypothetical protein
MLLDPVNRWRRKGSHVLVVLNPAHPESARIYTVARFWLVPAALATAGLGLIYLT